MNQNQENIQYDLVILLCASKLNQDNRFDELGARDGFPEYLGGQVRMEAAVDFAPKVKAYVVVGGSHEKVNDMKKFLEEAFQKYSIQPSPKIIRIVSDADTTGNLWALKLAFQKAQKLNVLKQGRIGILTNFYHLPRAMRFAADILNDTDINLIPIAAEAVIRRHQATFMVHPTATLFRIQNDINGLRDWERYEYKKQHKDEEAGWLHECLDQETLNSLKVYPIETSNEEG